MILVTSATGKTGRHLVPQLLARGREVRAFSRGASAAFAGMSGVEPFDGDLEDPSALRQAVAGMDAVLHVGPTMHPREIAIGTAVIDAACAAGVRKFVYMSVIHPQIDDLVNHQAKLGVERHLVDLRTDWTILQPQHYYQNIDVRDAVERGLFALPYSADMTLGFVDLADVAEVAAKVLTEDGHRWATYELAADEHLSTTEIAASIAEISGKPVASGRIDPQIVVDALTARFGASFDHRSANGIHRLFGYYDRYGITGNGNVLRCLLGREPGLLADYVRRELAATPDGAA